MNAPVMPFSQEAEEAVIGAILIDSTTLNELTFLRTEHFFLLRSQYIWAAVLALARRHEPVDFITIQSELKAAGKLNDVGGPGAILGLINNTPTSIHAAIYGKLVYRAAVRRQMIVAADQLTRAARDEQLPLDDVLKLAQGVVFGLLEANANRTHEHAMNDLVGQMLDEIIERMENPASSTTVTTGFRDLDFILAGGFWPEEVIVVAGRPGMGKTAIMLGMAKAAALAGKRVGITSLEMSALSLTRRMAAMESGIHHTALRTGKLSPEQWSLLLPHADRLSRLPILTNDQPAQTAAQVRACLRRWQAQGGIDIAFLDYLGLLHGDEKITSKRQLENRVREVDELMLTLKEAARELKIPLIVAAQLNRAVEGRQNKRPTSADLRESGGIEATADVVAMLYREVVYNEAADPSAAEIIITKQRNGPTDTVFLHYERTLTRFMDASRQRIDLNLLSGGGGHAARSERDAD